MMTSRKLALLAALAILTATGGAAAITSAPPTLLNMGRTGIQCYTQPCPWNGVWPADQAAQPSNLIWSGPTPPPMTGKEADLARVRGEYLQGCVMVEARFWDGVLTVGRIAGGC